MTATSEERWKRLRSEVLKQNPPVVVQAKGSLFVGADSRTLLRSIPDGTVDCIVTSPPYGSQKDYGSGNQIGFGQKSESVYLRDLGAALHELYRASKAGAAMWVVLDTVKRSGRTLVLPLEVIKRAGEEGWNYHDLVIWDKGRSLPWSHPGHFRGVFEYVLLFSKGELARFALDRVRDTDHLSSYWVKYPERFNPQGKAPSDLWHFPIPVQGSWSRKGIRHFCPFPLPMVARMINLTTKEGDVVIDPFAGTGAVIAAATYLGRRALGIDVNEGFVRTFAASGRNALLGAAASEIGNGSNGNAKSDLRDLVIRLRMLKYSRTLFAELLRPDRLGARARDCIAGFVVTPTHGRKASLGSLGGIAVRVLDRDAAGTEGLKEAVLAATKRPPLSKFGLRVTVNVVRASSWVPSRFLKDKQSRRWYIYRGGAFHKYVDTSTSAKLQATVRLECQAGVAGSQKQRRIPPIFSTLGVDVPLMVLD